MCQLADCRAVSSWMQTAYCQDDASRATGRRSRADGPIDEHRQKRRALPSSFSTSGFVAANAESQRQGPSSTIEGLTRQMMLAGFYQYTPAAASLVIDPQSSFSPIWATSTSTPSLHSSSNSSSHSHKAMARNYASFAASGDQQRSSMDWTKTETGMQQLHQDLQQQLQLQHDLQQQQQFQQYRHNPQLELEWGYTNYHQPVFPSGMAMPMDSSAVPRPVPAAATTPPLPTSQAMLQSVPSSLMTAMGECFMLPIEDFTLPMPMGPAAVTTTLPFAPQGVNLTPGMNDPSMDIVAALIAGSDSGDENDTTVNMSSREYEQQGRSMVSSLTDLSLNYAVSASISTATTTVDSGGFSDSRDVEDDGGWSSRSSSVAPPPSRSQSQARDPVRAPRPKRIRRRCTQPDCGKRARSLGLCIAHGGGKRCAVEGCNKSSQGGNMCIKHGGGKRCSFQGCDKAAQTNSLCKAHGGGPRCQFGNCMKSSQGGGLCRSHGGGKRCAVEGCDKGTQRGDLCALHGGSRLCEVPGCQRNDRGGGFCAHHGGGKRCHITNCTRPCRRHGLCSAHLRLLDMSEEAKAARSDDDYDEYDEDSHVV